jgi:hypothetical protein
MLSHDPILSPLCERRFPGSIRAKAGNCSSAVNSDRTSNAINNWDYRAIRGCQLVVDVYGTQRWVCP